MIMGRGDGSGLPLADIRIVDFSWIVAGPQATRIMADLGADVIKIENESHLDSMRLAGTNDGPPSYNRSPSFNQFNRNKRSMTVNLHHPEGRKAVEQLLAISDIVVENYSATVFERLGFGWERLQELNPRLIYLSLSGFGHTGRDAHYVTWGPTAQALSGLQQLSGLPAHEPAGWGYAYLDHNAGYYGAIALMLALRRREIDGVGQYIDLSQVETGMVVGGVAMLDYQVNGRRYEPIGNRSRNPKVAPHNTYRCLGDDRWIAIVAEADSQWRAVCNVLGARELLDDRRFSTNLARVRHEDELDAALTAFTRRFDARELMYLLQAQGVPAGVAQNQCDKMEYDPQLAARGFYVTAPHGELGDHRYEGLPFKFSRSRWDVVSGSPLFGEHTGEVLSETLGYSPEVIGTLIEELAVG